MIEVQQLTKVFRSIVAVDGVSFSVDKGEIIGFLGPNGAGKTTTMRMITGFIPPTSGSVRVAGFDVAEQPVEVRRRIGYLPETPPLYPEMRVRDYLRYIARMKSVPRKSVPGEIERVAARTGVSDVLGRVIDNLSKGYRQRVGLAQAIVGDPDVVILDEPTVGLDPNQIVEVRALIKELSGEHTVILSTHILAEVQMTCSRVVIIDKGRVVAADAIDRLLGQRSVASRLRLKIARPEGIAEKLQSMPAVASVRTDGDSDDRFIVEGQVGEDIREAVAACVVESGCGLLELVDLVPNLEDVFRQLTADSAASAPAPASEPPAPEPEPAPPPPEEPDTPESDDAA